MKVWETRGREGADRKPKAEVHPLKAPEVREEGISGTHSPESLQGKVELGIESDTAINSHLCASSPQRSLMFKMKRILEH